MNEDLLKALRAFAVPIGLILVFFIMIPRTCARRRATEQPAVASAAESSAPAAATGGGGLQIAGSPSRPAEADANTYPDGLDAARVQYLVEINTEFSQPVEATLSKTWDESQVTQALRNMKYIEKAADGSTSITRDGLMALQLRDNGTSWTIPIAKRSFDKVTHIARVDDDKYDLTVSWRYQPTSLGTALGIKDTLHSSIGHFIGSGRDWSLASWVTSPDVR